MKTAILAFVLLAGSALVIKFVVIPQYELQEIRKAQERKGIYTAHGWVFDFTEHEKQAFK